MNLYVGNLSPETSEKDLNAAFAEFGQVMSVKILIDPSTGLPRGFGFVEMAGRSEAFDAILNLDCTYLKGTIISVKEAKAKGDNNDRGGGDRQRRRTFTPRERGGYNSDRGGDRYNSDRGGYNSDRGDRGGDRGGDRFNKRY